MPVQTNFLVVEDSATMRFFLSRTLAEIFPGCTLAEAKDGKSALSELTRQRFDLIITDMQMPGMDGHAFVKLLKDNPVLARKPVLIFSNEVGEALNAKFAPFENVRLLSKPATAEALRSEIEALLGRITAEQP